MNRKAKQIIGSIIVICLITFIGYLIITKTSNDKKSSAIISSNFIGYDFARAVTGDSSNISMLLAPGSEAHTFEPTPEDIINIKNADLFIYVGGESEDWVNDLLENSEIPREKTIRLMDFIEAKEEKFPEGMEQSDEEEVEYDEHIWTSPINAIKLIDAIKDKLSTIHPETRDTYTKNASSYNSRLLAIDQEFRDIIKHSHKKELIFGDRFPFRYFVDEYGLDYYAAFPGCSEQTEASSQTIAFLINKAKSDHINTILKIELTSDKLANTIANEASAKVLVLNAAHNISKEDFDNGLTYADIMENNTKVLEEALN